MRSLKKAIAGIVAAVSVFSIFTAGTTSYAASGNTKTMEKHYDTYKDWFLYEGSMPDIVSREYKPDSKTKKLLDDAEKAGIVDSVLPASKEEADAKVYYKLVAQTASFSVFYIGGDEDNYSMIMKIGKTQYLEVSVPAVSYAGDMPQYMEYNLDEDDELEFVYKPDRFFHGTGYFEDLMLFADTDKNGKWQVYLLNPEKYMKEIAGQVEGKIVNGKATLYVNGKEEGTPVSEDQTFGGETPELYLESIVYVDLYDGKFWVEVEPMFDSVSGSSPEVRLFYPITYEGEGKYTGDKLICHPDYFNDFEKMYESFTDKDLYYSWEHPGFEIPVMLMADMKNSLKSDKTYIFNVSECKVVDIQNGKPKQIDTIKSGSAKNPVYISPDGVIVKGDHFLYIYGPDSTGKKITIKYGVEDDKISSFSNHKGYIRIVDGKVQNSTSFEFDEIQKKYEDVKPLSFYQR